MRVRVFRILKEHESRANFLKALRSMSVDAAVNGKLVGWKFESLEGDERF